MRFVCTSDQHGQISGGSLQMSAFTLTDEGIDSPSVTLCTIVFRIVNQDQLASTGNQGNVMSARVDMVAVSSRDIINQGVVTFGLT